MFCEVFITFGGRNMNDFLHFIWPPSQHFTSHYVSILMVWLWLCGLTSDSSNDDENVSRSAWISVLLMSVMSLKIFSLTFCWVWSSWWKRWRKHIAEDKRTHSSVTLLFFILQCNMKDNDQHNPRHVYRCYTQWCTLLCLPFSSGHLQILLCEELTPYLSAMCPSSWGQVHLLSVVKWPSLLEILADLSYLMIPKGLCQHLLMEQI